jgi:hypothetical protein
MRGEQCFPLFIVTDVLVIACEVRNWKRIRKITIVQADPEALDQNVQAKGEKESFPAFPLYDRPRTYGSWQESFI